MTLASAKKKGSLPVEFMDDSPQLSAKEMKAKAKEEEKARVRESRS